jgi:hypothetical protein
MQEAYGDLPVDLSVSATDRQGVIYSDEDITLGFDQREADDEYGSRINIRNFPY